MGALTERCRLLSAQGVGRRDVDGREGARGGAWKGLRLRLMLCAARDGAVSPRATTPSAFARPESRATVMATSRSPPI